MQAILNCLWATYSIALPIFLGYWVWRMQKGYERSEEGKAKVQAEKDKTQQRWQSIEASLMFLLRDSLMGRYNSYEERGHLTSEELRQFEKEYKLYQSLGGNSVANKWHEDIYELPIQEAHNG